MATLTRQQAMEISSAAGAGNSAKVAALLRDIDGDPCATGTWSFFAHRLADYIQGGYVGTPPFSIWNIDGNSKLPFASFSALPVVTCPGAAECIAYCYSFKAWRYPAAFMRQVQNTLLLRHNQHVVADATYALPQNTTCRLYVDGDFDSLRTLTFWMLVLHERSDLTVYGYSKSWNLFTMFDRLWAGKIGWPTNYLLNLSNGSKYENLRKYMVKLPVVRGNFIALPIERKLAGKYGQPEYKSAVRQAAKSAGLGRVFVCPGKCGECTKKGHLCGMESAKGVDVVIGVH